LLGPSSVLPNPSHQELSDHYERLPDKYFEADREQRINWMLDPKRGAIVDSKTVIFSHLVMVHKPTSISLFKKRNGEFVAAVKYYDLTPTTSLTSNSLSIKMLCGPK
jgi:hypothetical protein